MKFTIFIGVLLLCGCNEPTPSHVGPVVSADKLNTPGGGETYVYIIERNGHRLAIAVGSQGSGICEVTDASLVKTNAEAVK